MLKKEYNDIKEALEYLEYEIIGFSGNLVKCKNPDKEARELQYIIENKKIILKPVNFMEYVRTNKHGQMLDLDITNDDGTEVQLMDFGNRAILERYYKKNDHIEIEESDMFITETAITFEKEKDK